MWNYQRQSILKKPCNNHKARALWLLRDAKAHGEAYCDRSSERLIENRTSVRQEENKTQEHSTLLERIPAVQDSQSVWSLLLYCAAARANFWLRTTNPVHTEAFAQEHDRGVWRCLCQLLHVDPDSMPPLSRRKSFPSTVVGRTRLEISQAFARRCTLGHLADSLKMVFDRHSGMARRNCERLEGHHPAPRHPGSP